MWIKNTFSGKWVVFGPKWDPLTPNPPKRTKKKKRGRVSQVNPLQKLDLYYLSRWRKKNKFPINQYLNLKLNQSVSKCYPVWIMRNGISESVTVPQQSIFSCNGISGLWTFFVFLWYFSTGIAAFYEYIWLFFFVALYMPSFLVSFMIYALHLLTMKSSWFEAYIKPMRTCQIGHLHSWISAPLCICAHL